MKDWLKKVRPSFLSLNCRALILPPELPKTVHDQRDHIIRNALGGLALELRRQRDIMICMIRSRARTKKYMREIEEALKHCSDLDNSDV